MKEGGKLETLIKIEAGTHYSYLYQSFNQYLIEKQHVEPEIK